MSGTTRKKSAGKIAETVKKHQKTEKRTGQYTRDCKHTKFVVSVLGYYFCFGCFLLGHVQL